MLAERALPRFRDGSFKVPIERDFDMQEIGEAHRLMESNGRKGKVICRVG